MWSVRGASQQEGCAVNMQGLGMDGLNTGLNDILSIRTELMGFILPNGWVFVHRGVCFSKDEHRKACRQTLGHQAGL